MVGDAGLIAIDAPILATAVPSIVRDLGSYQQFPWLFSVYLLAQAVSVPVFASGGVTDLSDIDRLLEIEDDGVGGVSASAVSHGQGYAVVCGDANVAALMGIRRVRHGVPLS